mgnify:CR=1 FL=1
MQNFEELGRELERRGKTDKLKALADSQDVQKLGKMIDPAAVEQAAKSGDSNAIRSLLSSVLSTEEGRRLAQSVQQLMKD